MQYGNRISRYVSKEYCPSNKELKAKAEEVLNKVMTYDVDNNDKKKALAKFKKMYAESFETLYEAISYLLDMDITTQEKEIKKICKKLEIEDLYVNKQGVFANDNYKLENMFDFVNTVLSDARRHSTEAMRSIIDELSIDEIITIYDEIDHDPELLEFISKPYKNWYKKLPSGTPIYELVKSQECIILPYTKRILRDIVAKDDKEKEEPYMSLKSIAVYKTKKRKSSTHHYKWMEE